MRTICMLTAGLLAAPTLQATTPDDLLRDYTRQARADVVAYAGPSATAGQRFFVTRHGEWSCSTCHTSDPGTMGRHVVTGKPIAPLAPTANPERFRDAARAEKWFRRNCNDTLNRACTAAEKADVLAYLLSIQRGA